MDNLHKALGVKVAETIRTIALGMEEYPSPEAVTLTTYKTAESHARVYPGESWTFHKALITAVGVRLAGMGYKVRFIEASEEQ